MYDEIQEKIRDWRDEEHKKINDPTTSSRDKYAAYGADDAFLKVLRLLTEEEDRSQER